VTIIDKEIKAAELTVQAQLIDMQIGILQGSILRLDAMIEECEKLRQEIERNKKAVAA